MTSACADATPLLAPGTSKIGPGKSSLTIDHNILRKFPLQDSYVVAVFV